MLKHLRVTNFAILSDVAIDLSSGLNVFSGETGAGKSLIVEAVNLLRGGRASADIPRTGTDEAVVEAIFEVPSDLQTEISHILDAAGLPDDSPELLVRRVIHRGGRSRTYVNGALTTAACLAKLGAMLVDLSGQHQHQGLSNPKLHRAILDQFGNHNDLVESMRSAFKKYASSKQALAELETADAMREEKAQFLTFQLEELEAAELSPGEDTELEAERKRLRSVDRLQSAAHIAEHNVYSDDSSALERLDAGLRELEAVTSFDENLSGAVSVGQEARSLLDDFAQQLQHYLQNLDADPQRLSAVEERLTLVTRLKRKHGGGLAEAIAKTAKLRSELDRLENFEADKAELEKEVAVHEKQARKIAQQCSKSREKAAKSLAAGVRGSLAELDMKSARLTPILEPIDLGPEGHDRVELLLSSNRGEEAKPLAKIASGGELSRIMLAIKLALREADGVASYVFDEVDAGIGGATAQAVGKQIHGLATCRQVLCVTHLAQIAAFAGVSSAESHFRVSKSDVNGHTETNVTKLSKTARREEVARMLAGNKMSKRALAHAGELLEEAQTMSRTRPT